MKIVMMGAPGAGKGTQAKGLSERLGIPTISTGMMIRTAIRNETPLGLVAKSVIEKGDLLSDELIIDLVRERIAQEDCKNGFLLDGFPRTIPQAEALDAMGGIDVALLVDVSDEEILERLCGRRECKVCGTPYHIKFNPPANDGKCACGGELVHRSDDTPEVIGQRLSVYHEQTEPLCEYYRKTGKLKVAKGCIELEDTTRNVNAALGL